MKIQTGILFLSAMAVILTSWPVAAQVAAITNQPASRALWAGGYVRFVVGVSNGGACSYQWLFNSTNLPNGIITTVAGDGKWTNSGDGGLAVNAAIYTPIDMVVDPAGTTFITEDGNEDGYVRKVDTNGIITTVAGNGTNGFSGGGGPATNADLSQPEGLALDPAGNLYIADWDTGLIDKVDTNGIFTTVAGAGQKTSLGDGGPATNATIFLPSAVTLDSTGNLFIAEYARVRRVDTNGIITTFAGNGTNGFSGDGGSATNATVWGPLGLAMDHSGNLFIADGTDRIREVGTNGIIMTIAGVGPPSSGPPFPFSGDGGPATNATLAQPYGLALDSAGNLFIADQGHNRIRELDTNGIITTVAGNGAFAYSGDGGPATNASLYLPTGVAVDSFGNLFIADDVSSRIRKVTDTQGPVLALNNVTAANAGSYQLVVTGPGGSVTSSVVNLTVADTPLIYQTALNPDGSAILNCLSQPGSTNIVLWATNLLPPILWQPLATNLAGPDGNWQFTATNAAGSGPRFYRSLQQ